MEDEWLEQASSCSFKYYVRLTKRQLFRRHVPKHCAVYAIV
jgi:hypothetical protein